MENEVKPLKNYDFIVVNFKNVKDPKSWGFCIWFDCTEHWTRHLTWKCSILVTFLTATAGVSIIQTRETRERAQYGLSLLINSERSLCSIWGNKTHLHESEPCLFSLLLCSLTPGRQFQSLSSYLLQISWRVIRFDIFWSCYSVHLIHFRKLRCRVRLGIVQQSSCIINEDTLHSVTAVFLETSVCVRKFSKFYQVEDSVWDNFRKLDFHAIQHSYI